MKKHQVKSKFYYIFWGTATVSVLAGQLYVGSGYRKMADSVNRIFDEVLVEIEKNKFYDIENIECPPPVYLDT
jgi:hypothetical protein